jgi:hypothetical protein
LIGIVKLIILTPELVSGFFIVILKSKEEFIMSSFLVSSTATSIEGGQNLHLYYKNLRGIEKKLQRNNLSEYKKLVLLRNQNGLLRRIQKIESQNNPKTFFNEEGFRGA